MPLYNPYQPSQIPQAPQNLPTSTAQKRRQQQKNANMSLTDMLQHSNPKVRQAAKKAIEIQTAVNTVNTAANSGVSIEKFLSQNPNIAAVLKNAGLVPTPSASQPQILHPYRMAPRTVNTRDTFWTRSEFKEIVSETQKFMREQESTFSDLQRMRNARSIRSYEVSKTASATREAAAAQANAFAQKLGLSAKPGVMTAQSLTEQQAKASLAPVVSNTEVGSTAALIAQQNVPLPTDSMTTTDLQQAKTAFVPKLDKYGKLDVDAFGNPVYEPFQFDQPDTKSFWTSSDWKSYKKYIAAQDLPWWKEKWELGKFAFFQGGLKPAGEFLTNVFSVQKEYILQQDNTTLFNTTLNVAAN